MPNAWPSEQNRSWARRNYALHLDAYGLGLACPDEYWYASFALFVGKEQSKGSAAYGVVAYAHDYEFYAVVHIRVILYWNCR